MSRPRSSVAINGSNTNACNSASTCCVDRMGLKVFGDRLVAIRSVPGTVQGWRPPGTAFTVRVHALVASSAVPSSTPRTVRRMLVGRRRVALGRRDVGIALVAGELLRQHGVAAE